MLEFHDLPVHTWNVAESTTLMDWITKNVDRYPKASVQAAVTKHSLERVYDGPRKDLFLGLASYFHYASPPPPAGDAAGDAGEAKDTDTGRGHDDSF